MKKRYVHIYCAGACQLDGETFAVHKLEKTENVLSNSVGVKQSLHLDLLWCASVRKISHVR